MEHYTKLRSSFHTVRVLEEINDPERTPPLEQARANVALNGFAADRCEWLDADVNTTLRRLTDEVAGLADASQVVVAGQDEQGVARGHASTLTTPPERATRPSPLSPDPQLAPPRPGSTPGPPVRS